MNRPWPEIGDVVEDADGQRAIVTDIRHRTTWVLRPASGAVTTQWETDDGDTLHVILAREERLGRENGGGNGAPPG